MSPIDPKIAQITNAPEHHLRTVLEALCTTDPQTRDLIWNRLSNAGAFTPQPVKMMKRKAGDGENENDAIDGDSKRTKFPPDEHLCVRCGDTFLEEENGERACLYHTEDMEANDQHEFFADMNEFEGDWDDEEYQKECPEAFNYMCCDMDGTMKGCKYGWHWAVDDERGPVPFPDADADVDEDAGDRKEEPIKISDDEEEEEEEGSEGEERVTYK